jgi:hypothetical protein
LNRFDARAGGEGVEGAVTGRAPGEADCAASKDDPDASDDALPHNIVDHPRIKTAKRGNVFFMARIPPFKSAGPQLSLFGPVRLLTGMSA